MEPKVIISGGGTGGHIFPAIAIANGIKERFPLAEILFVGANGRMEMEKVPLAGYKILGLDIAGFQRKKILANLTLPFKIIKSLFQARKIIKDFKPNIAVGVGGYASGPLLWAASVSKIPTLIQEQNSYAGITNKILGKKASAICVAYAGMEKFFPKNKIILTGNPVRKDIFQTHSLRLPAALHFKLAADVPTILVIGGSLGAKTINEAITKDFHRIKERKIQLIWQTGKSFYQTAKDLCESHPKSNGWGDVKVLDFIPRMDLAYAAADIIISRAGALSIAELCLVGKPCILVPSPNVTEDHQTSNAMALVDKHAAILVKDFEAKEDLVCNALDLLKDEEHQEILKAQIQKMAFPHAVENIVNQIEKLWK